jgi:hypothetical protein
MHLIKQNVGFPKHFTSHSGFQDSLIRQWSVRPTNKAVVSVPSALAMSQKAQLEWRCLIERREASALDSKIVNLSEEFRLEDIGVHFCVGQLGK